MAGSYISSLLLSVVNNEESLRSAAPEVKQANGTHPTAQTPAAGSDRPRISQWKYIQKEFQRSTPCYLEWTAVRMSKGSQS